MLYFIKSLTENFLPKSSFVRGVVTLVGGTAGAQLIGIAAAPVLTRLFSPEDFGLLAVYGGLLAIIGVVASLRYELAIPLPEDDIAAANLVMLCLILLVAISLLNGVVMFIWGDSIAEMLGVKALADYLWLLPLGVLLSGVYTVFNYWGIRAKRFGDIAATKINQAVTTLVIQLVGFKLGGIALLLGQVAGQTAGTLTLAMPTIKNKGFKQLSLTKIKLVLLRYKEFPLYSTWSGLVNTAGHQLPPLIIAAVFSTGEAGLYALANRLLAMPANFIGVALAQVFLSHGVDSFRQGNLGLLYAKLQNTLIQIGLPPTILIVFVGPELFVIVFGEAWREAGVFSQWLGVGAFFGFVVSPLSQIFTIMEKQRLGLVLQFALFALRMMGISIGIFLDNILMAVILFSSGGAIGYLIYVIIGARLSKCSTHQFVKSLICGIGGGLIIVAPIAVGYYSGWQWLLIFLSLISFAIYVVGCIRLIQAKPL